jgi:hypothetical protein
MNFLEALHTGLSMLPIRSLPASRLILGHEKHLGTEVPRWREISTGAVIGLHSWDYTADDWEVMVNRT